MDRIERALELLIDDHVQFREDHKALLTSQVLLKDELSVLAKRTDQRFVEIAERFAATDERLNALITIVDGIIRRPSA
jgi:hypothetical protein